jgi:hypothetical protein
LQRLSDASFTGSWRVETRSLNRAAATDPLAQVTQVHLQSEGLHLEMPGSRLQGAWRVERDPLLSRPYLELQIAGEAVRALVTRLQHTLDGQYQALSLYFQSGLELFLVQP